MRPRPSAPTRPTSHILGCEEALHAPLSRDHTRAPFKSCITNAKTSVGLTTGRQGGPPTRKGSAVCPVKRSLRQSAHLDPGIILYNIRDKNGVLLAVMHVGVNSPTRSFIFAWHHDDSASSCSSLLSLLQRGLFTGNNEALSHQVQ